MLVPLVWQNNYVKIDEDLKTITDRLSETGSHVEEVTIITSQLESVVVGHVLEQEKHPDADRLQVLKIDIGKEDPSTIITAAKNTKKGDYLFVITSGTTMDNGDCIGDHDFFGINSEGMLTSYAELGYPDNVIPKEFKDGVIILNEEYKPGTPVSEVLSSDTPVIEYEITPNRPDCLSIIGMARETAASFGKKITLPSVDYKENDEDIKDYFNGVSIESENCAKFTTRVAKNVKVAKSPQWLQNYLILAGMRPINNIVDITNFVLLETGQPLHAYDLDKLADKKLIARQAKDGEVLKTLDREERKLDSDMLIIADGANPVGIAGVMGGFDTEVTDETTNIVLEAANFDGASVRETSKKLALRSESSTRFEKGLPLEMADFASRRAMKLISDLGIGEVVGGFIEEGKENSEEKTVDLRISRLNSLTGVDFSKEEAIKNLELLEFEVEDIDDNTIRAKVPFFRTDVEIEADLIEEIVRLYGMGKIEPKALYSSLQRGLRSDARLLRDDLKRELTDQKFAELTTYSFISPREFDRMGVLEDSHLREYIKLTNPLGEDFSVMRTTQISNMLDVIAKNINRGQKDLRLFELGKTFVKTDSNLPDENDTLTMGLYGAYNFYDLKDIFEVAMARVGFNGFTYKTQKENPIFHAGRCADIYYGDEFIGTMGEISYEVRDEYNIKKGALILEINLSQIRDQRIKNKKYTALPKYPAITRDYSFVTDRNLESKFIEDTIINNGGELVKNIELFDIYTGDQIENDKKSISYKVEFRSDDKTLKEEDIKDIEENILNDLEKSNIVLRS
ncbi:phenylalanine--tRNA ligase subunit beta [Anaerococcus sp. mt242]|uniref:phenylalanine--tRNA ligase subunit beta n=1 Tax=Anaerococcus sp. mt242 TaxID=2661917 RepID=UPI0019335B6F|nr:phenylalanine--tRNA ligase subunit beta [Anaerococcus sp. mt242]MBM0047002.1 phenylalanine--tRNA ligase subunit beta [Anaerococcus sp. mt242]